MTDILHLNQALLYRLDNKTTIDVNCQLILLYFYLHYHFIFTKKEWKLIGFIMINYKNVTLK